MEGWGHPDQQAGGRDERERISGLQSELERTNLALTATRSELEQLRAECAVCESCHHHQAEPGWCHVCGHRTRWPKWAEGVFEQARAAFNPQDVRALVAALIDFWPYIESRKHMGDPHPDYVRYGDAVEAAFVKVWLDDPEVTVTRVDGGALCPVCSHPYRSHPRGPGDFSSFARGCDGSVLKL